MTLPAQDIVERLRSYPRDRNGNFDKMEYLLIGDDAADTISRLTADNEAVRKERDETRAAHHRTSHKAVKRLRALWREKQAAESRVTALEADVERLRDALDDMLFEYGDKYDNECRLKNTSELDMIAKARAALGGSDHG